MAKDTPNKPDEVKKQPASEQPEQDTPATKPPATETPPAGEVVVSADKINELAGSKRKAAAKVEQDKQEQETPAAEGKPKTPDKAKSRPPKEAGADQLKPEEPKKSDKPAEKVIQLHPADSDEKLRQEQEALLKALDEKADSMTPAQKGGLKRKIRNQQVKDFVEGKRTSPFSDGKPVEQAAVAPQPKEAPRSEEPEQIVYLKLADLHAFKNHPFQVKDDEEMRAMVESVKDKGVTQPAIVRPRKGGGYEIVSGHRRQQASELAGYTDMPCIVRNLTDEQAITQMVEDNTNQRESILPSEKAKALKMQLEAIKRQGARDGSGNGQRSNEIVAQRNKMTVKQVQRYIKLNELVPDLMKLADENKLKFTPAVELAFIRPENQRYIALVIEAQQSSPNLSQAQRLRELDQKNMLNPDIIDGIMLEEKKEADKVILSSQELSEYFGKDKTPREMKDTILKLLGEWKKQQKELAAPEKKDKQPEK